MNKIIIYVSVYIDIKNVTLTYVFVIKKYANHKCILEWFLDKRGGKFKA